MSAGADGPVCHLIRARLDDPPRAPESLADLLSPDERARADRFVFPRDRRRHEVGTGLLRSALGAILGRHPADVAFETGAWGKPFVVDGPPFNLSHSGDWWLMGWAGEGRVGVDVEVHRELPDLAEVARHTFHPDEAARVLSHGGPERRAAFFRVWSRKEAFIKAVGRGLAYPLDGFVVDDAAAPGRSLLAVDDPADDPAQWRLESIGWAPDLAAALAWDRPAGRVEWRPFPGGSA